MPLDPQRLLWDESGKPQASVIYLAHLSDDERQFVVTLVLSKLVTWMRSQPGSSDLRALVYMDEVFGFVPPTAMPPAKKPILTILKQARAFGVGMLLSTQNPVDLDYKAMSNAGTWCVGRLQTERDKARILEALQSARGDTDVAELDRIVSGLGKRQFVLHSTREAEPAVFGTRWAMSYLRGPLTRDEVARLTASDPLRDRPEDAPASEPPPPPATDESPLAPETADGVPVYHLDPAAAWAGTVGASRDSQRLEASLAVRVRMTFDDRHADV
ncbi:MAG: ATP-binding protein, partial [Actinobacteria bacterium]|nr:ATP-binding protein [Actinomycetota bacterium]